MADRLLLHSTIVRPSMDMDVEQFGVRFQGHTVET